MNWAYIAGFFDGEGSITKNANGYRIQVVQTHEGVLQSMRVFSGIGFVVQVTKRQPHWKDCWVWGISRQDHVEKFLHHVRPYVVVKRKLLEYTLPLTRARAKKIRLARQQVQETIDRARELRKLGLTYRTIGLKLNIDYGYARRLILAIR